MSLERVCVSWRVTTSCDNQLIMGSKRSRSRQAYLYEDSVVLSPVNGLLEGNEWDCVASLQLCAEP